MTKRLKAIILKRKPSGDESLFLETLLENGEFGSFKIPGILKSHKRSSFHYAPGGVYEMIFHGEPTQRIIPKGSELVFSPYKDTQDFKTLSAVAEIVQTADFVKSSAENSELFVLIWRALAEIPAEKSALEIHLDSYYWNFLGLLGLANEGETDEQYAAYDLTAGFLTARELAERPHGDFILPAAWVRREQNVDSALCRETIRRYLKSL